jgi:hypothetical protein
LRAQLLDDNEDIFSAAAEFQADGNLEDCVKYVPMPPASDLAQSPV